MGDLYDTETYYFLSQALPTARQNESSWTARKPQFLKCLHINRLQYDIMNLHNFWIQPNKPKSLPLYQFGFFRCMLIWMTLGTMWSICQRLKRSIVTLSPTIDILPVQMIPDSCFCHTMFHWKFNYVGLSNILYSQGSKESSEFIFRREPAKGTHR